MTAHRMPTDTALVGYRKVRLNQRRQLIDHVIVHAVVLSPGFLGRVQVETCAKTEVIGSVRIVRNLGAARAGIWGDDN